LRIVAISDQHGHLDFEVPPCDLLLIGGDQAPDRFGGGGFPRGSREQQGQQLNWFRMKYKPWVQKQPARYVAGTWGNHDWFGQSFVGVPNLGTKPCMVSDQLLFFPARHRNTGLNPGGLLNSNEEPLDGGIIQVWFSPWSNEFCGWAFMKEPEDLAPHYAKIPEGVDIIVSHQPPYGYGDRVPEHYLMPSDKGERHKGSKELLAAIERVKPRVVICGHIHGGHGHYRHVFVGEGDLATDPHCDIYNVSVVDEGYTRVHAPTVIEL
jgi:hypothetical protein